MLSEASSHIHSNRTVNYRMVSHTFYKVDRLGSMLQSSAWYTHGDSVRSVITSFTFYHACLIYISFHACKANLAFFKHYIWQFGLVRVDCCCLFNTLKQIPRETDSLNPWEEL